MESRKFDFWAFAGMWMLFVLILVAVNMVWCSYFGNCLIDDVRHIHGEPFSFLKLIGVP